MYIRQISVALSSLLIGACGLWSDHPTGNPPLNSQRIEERFGSYGVLILAQADLRRETCLYSGNATVPVCRTIALVRFVAEPDPVLAAPLAKIRGGASLGATLASEGWQVRKLNRYVGEYPLGGDCDAGLARLLRICDPPPLALHIYELWAARNGVDREVATLLELHHPAYLSADDVQTIYARLDSRPLAPEELAGWVHWLGELTAPSGLFD